MQSSIIGARVQYCCGSPEIRLMHGVWVWAVVEGKNYI